MGRNRVIYQSQAVYAGPDKDPDSKDWRHETGTELPSQLQRIQSANYSFDIARQDVNQYGDLAAIDRVILESPTVSLDFSWYLCSLYNEDKLGFKINAHDADDGTRGTNFVSCLTDILGGAADERNYYVRIVKEGQDAAGYTETNASADGDQSRLIGVGNGFMSSYTAEGAVGGFPTSSLTIEALNMAFMKGTGGYTPYVTSSDGTKNATHLFGLPAVTSRTGSSLINAIKPGDITLTVPTSAASSVTDAKIQSFNLSFDLAREPLSKLGSRFAFAREITFPVTVTLSLDALVGDLTNDNLATVIDTDSEHEIMVHMRDGTNAPVGAAHTNSKDHISFVVKKAKLDSQSFTSSIGDNESVTLTFSAQLGSENQTDVGLFLSGKHA
jgi:hypothetical protein